MGGSPGREASKSILWKRIAVLFLSILLGLLLVEGLARARQWIRYGSPSGAAYELTVDPATGLRIPKPGMKTNHIQIDSRGFRNPEIEMPKPSGRIRLAFVGASTTFCAEVSSNEATWPELVCRQLRERFPQLSFDYINAGLPGFDLESSRKNFEARVLPLEPDVVIYYEAANDFSMDTRRLARERGVYTGKPEDPSWLARRSVVWYLIEKNLAVRERQRGLGQGHTLSYDPGPLARSFESRLVEFLEEARRVAPVCAVATFSHKVRRDQPPDVQLRNCNTSLYYAPYMTVRGILDGWDAYNQAIRDAAQRTGAILIGGEAEIPADDLHFADSVHFRDAGARAQAERITKGLMASPEFRRFLELRHGAPLG